MLTIISDLSTRFVALPSREVDRHIKESLPRVCEAFGVDLVSLWEWSAIPPCALSLTHFHYALEGEESAAALNAEQFPWFGEEARTGRTVAFSTLDELPREAVVDRETCLHLGVKSSL